MDSTSWRSAGMLVAAAVMLVVLRPVLGVAEVQAAELSGTVTDVTGGRLTGVAVEARPVGAAGPIQTASTDSTGMFTLSTLQAWCLRRDVLAARIPGSRIR